MRKILFIILLLPLSLTAQNFISLEGKVISREDSLPIDNVHIFILGETIGTTTNLEGNFRLNIPESYLDKRVAISCVGYNYLEKSIDLESKSNFLIYLDKNTIELEEVTIKPIDAKKIIKIAIENMNVNYPKEIYTYNVFYKEIAKVNSNYYRFQEIAALISNSGFSKKYVGRKNYPIKIIGKRSSFNYFNKSDGGNGLFVVLWLNWAKDNFTKKALKDFIFEYDGMDKYDNVNIFRVKVLRPKLNLETDIYITSDTYAIVYIKAKYQNYKQQEPKGDMTWFTKEFEFEVKFRQLKKLWYLNSIYDYRYNGLKNDSTVTIIRSLDVNEIKKGKLKTEDEIRSETDLFKYPYPYDPKFWKTYNAPLETQKEKMIKLDLERNGVSLQKQFNN